MNVRSVLAWLCLILLIGCGKSDNTGDDKVAVTSSDAVVKSDPQAKADKNLDELYKQVDALTGAKSKANLASRTERSTKFVQLVREIGYGSSMAGGGMDVATVTALPNGWIMYQGLDGRWFIVEFTPERSQDVFGKVVELGH